MAEPVKIVIVFYSRNGSTAALAEGIAEGARGEGAEVTLRRVDELVSEDIINSVPGWKESRETLKAKYQTPTLDEIEGADAIIWGSPTRFGNVSSELKAFVDSLGGLWFQGKLDGKVGSAFTSTSSLHGGNESTNITMYNFMAHLGQIIVPVGYGDPVTFKAGTPYGASTVSGQTNAPPTPDDLDVARYQGKRVAKITSALKAAKASA